MYWLIECITPQNCGDGHSLQSSTTVSVYTCTLSSSQPKHDTALSHLSIDVVPGLVDLPEAASPDLLEDLPAIL